MCVVSSLAIHNVPSSGDRAQAIREIVRVLKPGGRIGILDIANVGAYADELRSNGCTIEPSGWCATPSVPRGSLRSKASNAPTS